MFEWNLDRPLAVFDLEATGTSPRADRIVEICIIKIMPDGQRPSHTFRINPGIPIPEEVTKIHGISDADVVDCPHFTDLACQLSEILNGCDLAGYNLLHFDIPMLTEEFIRAGFTFSVEGRRVIDAQRIFHKREPRDLTAALAYYCDQEHLNAHGAESDVVATISVLEGQFNKYPDLPQEMDALSDYCNPRNPSWVDASGRLKWSNGNILLNFGRKKGTPLKQIIDNDPGFIKWMLRSDFPLDTRKIVTNAVDGTWPTPPE